MITRSPILNRYGYGMGLRHSLTNVDPERRRGDCAACGPDTPVRGRVRKDRPGLNWQCRRPGESRETTASRQRRKHAERLRRYGLTEEEYAALVAAHGDGCAICGSPDTDRRLSIDHCHRTGRVRGLLCKAHNRGLGFFGDDPDLLRAAADYLQRGSVASG